MKAAELKELIQVVETGIFRFLEFLDREQIINPRVRRNLARCKEYFERAVNEVRRY